MRAVSKIINKPDETRITSYGYLIEAWKFIDKESVEEYFIVVFLLFLFAFPYFLDSDWTNRWTCSAVRLKTFLLVLEMSRRGNAGRLALQNRSNLLLECTDSYSLELTDSCSLELTVSLSDTYYEENSD